MAKARARKGPRRPVTLVTGATEGLGLALAREFARNGHALLLVARSAKPLGRLAGALQREFGVVVHTQSADLTSGEGCDRVARAVEARGLTVEYLVNNAGFGQAGAFAGARRGALLALVDLNMRALTDLTRRFLPGMIERGGGGVLNVASLAGFAPGPFQAAYYASKAYVLSLSEALAHEVWGTRVRVAALAPGPLATAFHQRAGGETAYYTRFLGEMEAEVVARVGYRNFMCGQKVIVPGLFNMASAAGLRLIPHPLMLPFVGWLLKPRAGPGAAGTGARASRGRASGKRKRLSATKASATGK